MLGNATDPLAALASPYRQVGAEKREVLRLIPATIAVRSSLTTPFGDYNRIRTGSRACSDAPPQILSAFGREISRRFTRFPREKSRSENARAVGRGFSCARPTPDS